MLSRRFSKYVLWSCGRAVERLSTGLVQIGGFVHQVVLCTHFVRSLWVSLGTFTSFVRSTFTRVYSFIVSVSQYLYPFSTPPTITSTFSNQIIY